MHSLACLHRCSVAMDILIRQTLSLRMPLLFLAYMHGLKLALHTQVSAQSWKGGDVSIMAGGEPRIAFTDSASLTQQTLVEGRACSLLLELSSQVVACTHVAAPAEAAAGSWTGPVWDGSAACTSLPRPRPLGPGTALTLRYASMRESACSLCNDPNFAGQFLCRGYRSQYAHRQRMVADNLQASMCI